MFYNEFPFNQQEGSVSTHIYVTELKLAGNVTLNK